MSALDPIVVSFQNKAFELGEWLLKNGALTKEDLDECQEAILMGLPMLAILNAVYYSANFDDGCVHLAVNRMVSPHDPAYSEEIRMILAKILLGAQIYREVNFTCATYDDYKKSLIQKVKGEVRFNGSWNELYKVLYEIALTITKIDEYKQKFINVINCLSALEV